MSCFDSIPDAVIAHTMIPYLPMKDAVTLASVDKHCREVIIPELKKHISFSYKDGSVIFLRKCKRTTIKNCTRILISSKISNTKRHFFLKFEYYARIKNPGYDSNDSYANYNAYPYETKTKKYNITKEKAITYGSAIKSLSVELNNTHAFIGKSKLDPYNVTFQVQEMPPYNDDDYADDYAEDYEEIYPTYEEYLIEQGEIDHRIIMRELVGELKGCIPIIL
jgi:hypothetical protein